MRAEFQEERDAMKSEFDEERKQRRRTMNNFLLGFGALILMYAFSAGIIVQKVNSFGKSHNEVSNKVETLYMVAVQKGDIDPFGNPRGTKSDGS
jgi:hypothetical protein